MSYGPRVRNVSLLFLGLLGCSAPEVASVADLGAPDAGLRVLARTDALLLGLWRDETRAWLVGGHSGGDGVVAELSDSGLSAWPIPPGPTLWWAWGAGADAVWACGDGGRVLRFDGDRWRPEVTGLPAEVTLWGLWGSGPGDLWAVGGSPRAGGPKGIVLRSSGDGRWRRVEPPGGLDRDLYKLWGTGPDDVFIVGVGVALHYDGHRLRRFDPPDGDRLVTVHGRPGGPVLAVGGLSAGVALRWTGEGWVREALPAGTPGLSGVFVRSDGGAIAAGMRGVVLHRDLEGRWARRGPVDGIDGETLHAVWGEGDELLFFTINFSS